MSAIGKKYSVEIMRIIKKKKKKLICHFINNIFQVKIDDSNIEKLIMTSSFYI